MFTFSSEPAATKHAPGARRVAIMGAAIVIATAILYAGASGNLAQRASADVASTSNAVASTTMTDKAIAEIQQDIDKESVWAEKQAAAADATEKAKAAATAAAAARAAAAEAAAEKAAAAASNLTVWTAGFQTQINACRGAVDVTAHYGTRAVAEHWQCGGSSFPTASGTIIHITGIDAGTYRVVGLVAVLNAYTANTSDIPHGYSLLFQTCRNGDSHTTEFVALQRIR